MNRINYYRQQLQISIPLLRKAKKQLEKATKEYDLGVRWLSPDSPDIWNVNCLSPRDLVKYYTNIVTVQYSLYRAYMDKVLIDIDDC